MKDSVQSIFSQLRKSRELAAMNEAEEAKKAEALNESEEVKEVENKEEVPAPAEEAPAEKPAEEAPVNESVGDGEKPAEEAPIDEAEEFVVIKCHDCGAILSGLDEANDGCPVCGSDDLDEKTVRVVRDGKVVKKNVPTRKKRLTAAQKAALAKARKKAHTASANKSRAKSNKVRKNKGMNEEDTIVCPECDYEGQYDDFDHENGATLCPDCGAHVDVEE